MVKARKRVLISDFDGTLAWLSLPYCVHHWMSQHRNGLILLIPLLPIAYVLYILRPCKKTAKQTILEHKAEGGRVVVFSSTEDLRITRFIIWSWLRVRSVPCDRLVLRPHKELTDNFKAEVLIEEGCDVLLENETPMVVLLIGKMLEFGFQITSTATQQRYSKVCFQKRR
jgi:hypothetical protein